MKKSFVMFWLTSFCGLVFVADLSYTEEITFPEDAGIVNVKEAPYHAKGDGMSDDTKALQKALSDHPSGNKIIYLPKGTYMISDTLRWPGGSHGGLAQKRTILQGQNREQTIIRLKDSARGFTDPQNPKSMIWTGRKPAQRFRNAIRNLTISVGQNNSGAIGCQFIANNQGCVRNVLIRSEDGQGAIGLDMAYTDEVGPCLIEKLTVHGFDVGVKSAYAVDSITIHNISLYNQNLYGLWNNGQCLSIERLHSSQNAAVSIYNQGSVGLLSLVSATLHGKNLSTPAIVNEAFMFARNIENRGYETTIENRNDKGKSVTDNHVDEFVSHKGYALFDNNSKSLNLNMEEKPEIPFDFVAQWISPLQFGAQPNDEEDDTEAIQKAIDFGKTTVYLPNGTWIIDGTLVLRGKVKRFIGCEARIGGDGVLRIDDGESDTVIVERLQINYGSEWSIVQNTERQVVLSSSILGVVRNAKPGTMFIDDICGGPFHFKNHTVYARQWNAESPTTKIVNDGGTMWILGLKTERGGTLIHTKNGGKTELLGGFCYATSNEKVKPMFINENSSVSLTIRESCFNGNPFKILVEEIREGETRRLMRGDVPGRSGGSVIPLYTGTTK